MAPFCSGKEVKLQHPFHQVKQNSWNTELNYQKAGLASTECGRKQHPAEPWAHTWFPALFKAKEAQHHSCLLSNPFEGLSCQEELPQFLLIDKTFQEKGSLILAQLLPGI